MKKFAKAAVLAAVSCAVLAGCASVPEGAGSNPADPWESMNRQTHAFNDGADRYVFRPIAKGYKAVTPEPVRSCVSNMMDNLTEPRNMVNNALQGKGKGAFESFMRFIVNSTFGLLGCFDVAKMGELQPQPEDFGQTLGVWGVGNGPYLVLPFLGPSTVRDAAGRGVNWATSIQTWVDPSWAGWAVWGVDAVDARTRLLDLDGMMDTAVDPYAQMRDGYLQFRRNQVYDGNPPAEDFAEDPGEDPADKPAAENK